MTQKHLKFGSFEAPEVDEDGYSLSYATTSSDDSGRIMSGVMMNTPLFTVEAYKLKWSDISAANAAKILQEIKGKKQYDFFHFNVYSGKWETSPFYTANIETAFYSLVDGEEKCSELSFQATGVNPV
jgi:hypothetical protein